MSKHNEILQWVRYGYEAAKRGQTQDQMVAEVIQLMREDDREKASMKEAARQKKAAENTDK